MINIEERREKIKRFIESVENSKVPMIYFILTFVFIVALRNFFDAITDTTVSTATRFSASFHLTSAANFFSNSFWYAGLALVLIIIIHFAIKERIEKIARLILPGFIVLLTVPLVDFILSGGNGFNQSYMLPGIHDDLLARWLTFSIPYNTGMGVTPGMKTEAVLVIIGIFGYIYLKKRSVIRSAAFSFIVYTAVFFWGAMPFAIKYFLNAFNIEYLLTSEIILNFTLFLILIFGIIAYYLYNKTYFIALLKDLSIFRAIHYELMFILGIFLALNLFNKSITLTQETIFSWVFAPIAIFFAGTFSFIINNIHDYHIDKISNVQRSTVTGAISKDHYKHLAILMFFLALLYSAVIDHITVFIIFIWIGSYFLYSAPPFRLKRIPFFSKFFIAFNSLILVMLGFYFVTGYTDIPFIIFVYFLIGFTIVMNFIDLKDYEGDKEVGIRTIPTILGLRNSKIIIGIFFMLFHFILGFRLGNITFLGVSVCLGVLQFFLVNRKNYNEKYVFAVYLFSLMLFIFYLMANPLVIPGYTP